MADDSLLWGMRPNSILAEGPEFHSCRYSSWSRGRGASVRDGDLHRSKYGDVAARQGDTGRQGGTANPWTKMEGELERLDAANIKITEVDLQCMGDSDNVMYEFRLEEDGSAHNSPGKRVSPTTGGLIEDSHVGGPHLPPGVMSSHPVPGYGDHPGNIAIHQLSRSGGGTGSGPIRLGHLAAAAGVHLSPHHSLHGSPNLSPRAHPSAALGGGPPRTRLLQIVAASDAEVEGYFSALESLQASPREEGEGEEYDEQSLGSEDQDMLRAEQLTRLLYAAQGLSPGSCGVMTAGSLSASPGSSQFSSPLHHLSPALTAHTHLAQSNLTRLASNLGRPGTSHAGNGLHSPTRVQSPKATRTSTAPLEREGKAWPGFPSRAASGEKGSSSPVRAGSRLRGASRLRSSCPGGGDSCDSLTSLGDSSDDGTPISAAADREFVVAESAVDLEALTSLDLGTLEAARPGKSRLARLHEARPGGSGPLVPRHDMEGEFNPEARQRWGTSSWSQDDGGSSRPLQPMTPSRYEDAAKARHSRTASWTMGGKDTDFLDLAGDPEEPAAGNLSAFGLRGCQDTVAPEASPAGDVQGPPAVGVPGEDQPTQEPKGHSRKQEASEHASLLKRLSRKIGWGRKPQHAAGAASSPLSTAEAQASGSFDPAPDTVPPGPTAATAAGAAVGTSEAAAAAPQASKYTMSRKKRQEMERMQFTRPAVARPVEAAVSVPRSVSDHS